MMIDNRVTRCVLPVALHFLISILDVLYTCYIRHSYNVWVNEGGIVQDERGIMVRKNEK